MNVHPCHMNCPQMHLWDSDAPPQPTVHLWDALPADLSMDLLCAQNAVLDQ